MRKLVNPVPAGGAPLFGDSVFGPVIQDIYSALEAFLNNSYGASTQGIIISGCVVTANGGNWDCSSGLVYLNGKIMPFAGFTNQPASKYIVAASLTNTAKTFFDGVSRNILTVENATFQGSIPGAGQYISINSSPQRLTNISFFPVQQGGAGIQNANDKLNLGWTSSVDLRLSVNGFDVGRIPTEFNMSSFAGNGLSVSGGTGSTVFDVNTDDVTIEKNSDTLRAKALSWNNITLINGWTGTLQYALDGRGLCHLRGSLNGAGSASSNTITSTGAVPNPLTSAGFILDDVGTASSMYNFRISTSGQLSMVGSFGSVISLYIGAVKYAV